MSWRKFVRRQGLFAGSRAERVACSLLGTGAVGFSFLPACWKSHKALCDGDGDVTLLPPEKLNQPAGRPQSLNAWTIIREGSDHYVQNCKDRNEVYKAPDGSNFVGGVAHPPFIRQRNWTNLKESMPAYNRPSDIWVATYPKCGTTFMEQIILLLLNQGDVSSMDPKTQNHYDPESGIGKIWVEANVRAPGITDPGVRDRLTWTLEEFDALPAPRVLKTHAPRHMFLGVSPISPASLSERGQPHPIAPGVKVVYVSRNAKDACVSAYYHAANPHKLGFPFDAWVKNWMSGLFEHGRWSDHVLAWRAESLANPNQVLWVRYEDLKLNAEKEIRRVAEFLGIDASDEVISKTVHGSGFKQMKEQAGTAFFRKGAVGDYRRHFSASLDAEFDELYSKQMRGASDPYADIQSRL